MYGDDTHEVGSCWFWFWFWVGMTATAAQALLENLDRIPNEDSHTKIALIGFDTSLYFFSMPVRNPSFPSLPQNPPTP